MTVTEPAADHTNEPASDTVDGPTEDVVGDDVLVEEISIDGMCGVY